MIDEQSASTVPVEMSPEQSQSRRRPSGHTDELPDMIPVRMLNEFTYCPRLGYLKWVEGEWAGNLETMEGTFGHRRVDQAPKRAGRKAEKLKAGSGKPKQRMTNAQHPMTNPENSKNRAFMLDH